MGDFNDILEASEKDGGRPRTVQSMDAFCGFVTASNLLDLGYEGCPFTWRNRQDDGARVVHQVAEGSDHVMLLLYTLHSSPRRASRFIFYPRWSALERCHDLVKERWRRGFRGSRGLQVFEKLKWVQKGLVHWKRQEWRNSKICIDRLRIELQTELQACEYDGKKWLCKRDKNTKFFHSKVLVRRRVNRLLGLEDPSGVWHAEAFDIRRIAESYFQDLFSSDNPMGVGAVLECVRAFVTSQDNMSLSQPVLEDEVLVAVKQLDPIKSPGSDRFIGSFYQKFWSTIGDDILGLVQSFFHSGRMFRKLNHTHIT
ncbi:unnamed protein product [Prunus armeniaca]|uniref:Uncharacterized protein n=1 Tax=Prunus armeniaca TaxID=36596 RepID=A0A6J5X8E1_PRUAR|nr:unnamed protein product [Prunus armeniaca]